MAAALFVLMAGPSLAQAQSGDGTCAPVPAAQQASPPAQAAEGQAHDPEPPADTKTSADVDERSSAAVPHVKSSDHMFGVLPNYATVEDATEATPVDVRQKFKMASLNTFDPYVYPFVGVVATLNHTYGSGTSGYLKQYAASFADNSIGNLLTSSVLPSVLHQDPRYFEHGSGGFLRRLAYAASRSAVTRSDSGHAQFNVSEIGGNAIAAGLSNLYYPSAERTLTDTLTRWGMQGMWDTLSNELKEFWPDVRRKLHGQ